MTESQVESLFLVPPGDYTTRPDVPMVYNFCRGQTHLRWRTWYSDRAAVAIGFDKNGKVGGFAVAFNDSPDNSLEYKVNRFLAACQQHAVSEGTVGPSQLEKVDQHAA
jgi:hypothetical protein